MRTPYAPVRRRRILCVSPRYTPSFGTFYYAYPLFGTRIRAFMPPQGLLVVAAYLPESWEVRFVDENARVAAPEELAWADAVLVSGMHVQRAFIQDVIARTTAIPAKVIQRPQLGNLTVGSEADVAVFRLREGTFGFLDARGQRVDGTRKLEAELTIRAGRVVWDLNGLAAPAYRP